MQRVRVQVRMFVCVVSILTEVLDLTLSIADSLRKSGSDDSVAVQRTVTAIGVRPCERDVPRMDSWVDGWVRMGEERTIR